MNTVVQQRLDRWLRVAAPLLLILLISFLGLINLPFPNYTTIAPAYTLIAVYCWTVWRPDLVPYIGVFAIGVFEDFLLPLRQWMAGGCPGWTIACIFFPAFSHVH